MTSPAAKRQCHGINEKEGPEEAASSPAVDWTALPSGVWNLVVSFLKPKPVARLALFTSKRLAAAIAGTDENHDHCHDPAIWKLIMFHLWGEESSQDLLDKTGWSAETCVQLFSPMRGRWRWVDEIPTVTGELQHRPTEPMPRPLQYSPHDYVIVVTVQGSHPTEDEFFFLKTIRGSEIPEFFETGEANVYFQDPVAKIINRKLHLREDALYYGRGMYIGSTRMVTIVRLSDKSIANFGMCSGGDFVGDDLRDYYSEGFDKNWWVGYGGTSCSLYGHYFMRHLDMDCLCRTFRSTVEVDCLLHYQPASTRRTNDSIGIFGFRLKAMFESLDGPCFVAQTLHALRKDDPVRYQNITFAHFLDALHFPIEVRDDNGGLASPVKRLQYFDHNPSSEDEGDSSDEYDDDVSHDLQEGEAPH